MEFETNIRYIRGAYVKKYEAGKQKTTEPHFDGLIGYQTPPLIQKCCTVSLSGNQSLKLSHAFLVLLLVICLKTCKVLAANNLPTLLRSRL